MIFHSYVSIPEGRGIDDSKTGRAPPHRQLPLAHDASRGGHCEHPNPWRFGGINTPLMNATLKI